MQTIRPLITVHSLSALLLGLAILLAGCGNTRFGSELSARPRAHPIRATTSTKIHLPREESFSITLPQASKQPGLDGQAEADADATGEGTAEATASVTNSGNALGLFQLGHAFENSTNRQIDFDFNVTFHYSFEANTSTESGFPDATVGLKLYARGQRGRLLRDMTIVEYSTENGPARRQAEERINFTLTLAPGETVSVFLAGQVRVEIRAGRSASGSLKLSDLQMEVSLQPVPAVQAAKNEQP